MRDIAQVFQTLVISQRNNRNGGSGESRLLACSSRQPAANRFQAHIRLAKEDIRRSGRMQQAGSLRSPDPRLRSRQWEKLQCRRWLDSAAVLHYQSP